MTDQRHFNVRRCLILCESCRKLIPPAIHMYRGYGYAAARAYTAYKDRKFLDFAIQSWWVGRHYTISQEDASSGTMSVKNFPISSQCNNREYAAALYCILVDSLGRNDGRRYILGMSFGTLFPCGIHTRPGHRCNGHPGGRPLYRVSRALDK
jgi:hypothetical protein